METRNGKYSGGSGSGSYRTYEEWKQNLSSTMSELIQVLTVPMRNGNDGVEFCGSGLKHVLTVPMRNGNR